MQSIIGCCGIKCHTCGAYMATKNNDDKKRKETARSWSKMYNSNIQPEDINCLGCTSENEPLFNHCHICDIRKCAREKRVVNCAYCDAYLCERLDAFFESVPDAKKNLDAIKGN